MAKLVDFKTLTGETIKVSSNMVESLNDYLELFPKYDIIKRVILFGSTLEERCNKDSDIDFYIVYEGTTSDFDDLVFSMFHEYRDVALDDFLDCNINDYDPTCTRGLLGEVNRKGKVLYDCM